MESSSFAGDLLSPESTVTSLLSSSGHLRSSLLPPEHNTTIRYRDKDYDSASAALDAYIEDFERSRHHVGSLTGTLVLPCNHTSTSSKDQVRTLRNRDVLRERLTDWELDYLNLPVTSHAGQRNLNRLSMTTDDLLSIPHDGSMPVTHTSAFIQGLLSQSGTSQRLPFSAGPASKVCPGLNSNQAKPTHLSQDHHYPLHTRIPRTHRYRGRPKVAPLKQGVDNSSFVHRAVRSERAQPSSSLHLPHWFTSNKAHMDCSEINSVPDLSYPAWIQHCDLSEAPPHPASEPWDEHSILPRGTSQITAPSWVSDLEKDNSNPPLEQLDSQQMLRDLRLQLAEQISLLATEGKDSDVLKALFRDNRIETLIQKADQVLNLLSQSSERTESAADPVNSAALSPPGTEELLRSKSQYLPFTQSSAAGGLPEAPADREVKVVGCDPHGNSIWKQPGPVEALKQMMFRLQAVETELEKKLKRPVSPPLPETLQTPVKQLPDCEEELQGFTGSPSLQRALHHLNRLKMLVEEPRQKRGNEEGRGSC